jgi:hypothetical protein
MLAALLLLTQTLTQPAAAVQGLLVQMVTHQEQVTAA